MIATSSLPSSSSNSLRTALDRWHATVESELKGAPFEKKLVTPISDGIALRPLYTRADTEQVPDLNARPGAAPFLRGVRPLGYREEKWLVAQQISAPDATAFNAAIVADLMAGQNAVPLAADVATRRGLDPDDAPASEVGAGGLSVADVTDLAAALRGVALYAVPIFFRTGADPLPLAALFCEYARSAGVDWTKLTGSVTADPLGECAERGAIAGGLEAGYASLAGWTTWAQKYAPNLRTIGINAMPWNEAGATPAQELAFALAAGAEYLRELKARGVAVQEAAARVDFSFCVGAQFFTEVAKFRAIRPLWTRVVTAFGAVPEAAGGATVGAATAKWNKTLLDPHVNMLRVTTEALSAVLGGCDRLHVSPFDEVSGVTTEFSRRIARNVHTLLAEEFSFGETADPAGGSWYIEKLTDELARAAWALFQDIEARGGMAAALIAGYPQQLVEKAAAGKREGLAKRRLALVGTNLYPNLKETPLARATADEAARQSRRAAEIVARRRRGVVPPVSTTDWATRFAVALQAAQDGATVGQLSGFSRTGTEKCASVRALTPRRAAEDFESLRSSSAAYAARTGIRPRVFLAKIGPVLQHKARADFSAGFFGVGGFEVLAKQSFPTAEDAAAAAIASQAPVAVLCSTDDTYASLVPAFAAAVRAAAPQLTLILAGLPADPATVATFQQAGIDEFIHLRANVHDVLAGLLKKMGAL